jgi:chromosome segregation ATPase
MIVADRAQRKASRRVREPAILDLRPEHDRQTDQADLASELELARAEIVALKEQLTRKTIAAKIQDEHRKSFVSQIAASNGRITDLEAELDLAREGVVHCENENRSLQTSLDLCLGENSRLAGQLSESNATAGKACSLVAGLRTALSKAASERDELPAAVDRERSRSTRLKTALIEAVTERNDLIAGLNKTKTETNALNTRLKAALKRAVSAEKSLAKVHQTLLEKVELLENALLGKDRQIQELELARSKLIGAMKRLLKSFKGRDSALALAKTRIDFLAQRLTEFRGATGLAKNREKTEELDLRPQRVCADAAPVAAAQGNGFTTCNELEHELDIIVNRNGPLPNELATRFTQTLLADTITL